MKYREIKPAFDDFMYFKHKYRVVVACRGGGKTIAALQDLCLHLTKIRNFNSVFFSGSLSSAEASSKEFLQEYAKSIEELNSYAKCKYLKSKMYWEFDFGESDKRYIYLKSYQDCELQRGVRYHHAILDECSLMPHNMFESVISPMMHLKENTGINSRVVFIGTAKDGTDFKKFYQRGIYKPEEENSENERWKSFTFKADDGELISKEEVNRIKMWMDKDIFEQEYNCNFEVCAGSEYIYYRELVRITKNINSDITYDLAKPVYTSWDLGHGDFTVIWFYQVHGSELHFIDYYEGKHEHISTHAANILDKGYTHGKSLIPHDGIAHRVDTITTTEETLFEFGLRPVILKRTPNKWASIIESRLMLRRCYFNKEKCEVGLHHLKNFKRRVNKNTGIAEDNPIHDEHMDACDAFRYVSEGRAHWEHAQVIHDNDPNTYYNNDNYWY